MHTVGDNGWVLSGSDVSTSAWALLAFLLLRLQHNHTERNRKRAVAGAAVGDDFATTVAERLALAELPPLCLSQVEVLRPNFDILLMVVGPEVFGQPHCKTTCTCLQWETRHIRPLMC